MLLNMFFGPAVNASRAIAVQIQSAIMGFATNFTMAINPQIVQNYAQGKKEEIFRLVCYSSKFSFFLLLLLALPVLLETELLLKLWLKQVPDYSVVFVRLVLIQMLIRILQNPLHTLMHATGRLRKYQLMDGTLLLLNIPVSYWLLKDGGDATVVLIVSIIFTFMALVALLYVGWSATGFSVYVFWQKVIWRVLMVSILLGLMIYVFKKCLLEFQSLTYWFGEVFILPASVLLIWNVGMERNERNLFRGYWKVFLVKVHLRSK